MPNSKNSITNRNKILSCLFSATLAISVLLSGNSQAATREEVAAVKVEKAADFRYWNGDSPTLKKNYAICGRSNPARSPAFYSGFPARGCL